MHAVTATYHDNGGVDELAGPLAAPVRVVSVNGKTATLVVAHQMNLGNLLYAQAWEQTYNEHHARAAPCVHLRVMWDKTIETQQCCRASL